MSTIDAFCRHYEPPFPRFGKVELPNMFKRRPITGRLFEHLKIGRRFAPKMSGGETSLHDFSPHRTVIGAGRRRAALPLADSFIGNHRFAVMRFSPGITRLMLGVVGIGIKETRGIRQVQHPLAEVARVSRVIARQRHQCARPLKCVHGKGIASAVRGTPDQAMRIQTIPAIRYYSPPRPRLRLAARFKATIHQLGDIVMTT